MSRRDDPRRLLGGYGEAFTIGRQAVTSRSASSDGGHHTAMAMTASGSVAGDLVEGGAVAAGSGGDASTKPRGYDAGATAITTDARHFGEGGQSLSSCSDTSSSTYWREGVGSGSGGVGVGVGGVGVSSSPEKDGAAPRSSTARLDLSADALASCAAVTAVETALSDRQSPNMLQNRSPAGVPRASGDTATTSGENSRLSDQGNTRSSIKNASSSACEPIPNKRSQRAKSRWGVRPSLNVSCSSDDDAKAPASDHMPPPPLAPSGSATVLKCDRPSENKGAPSTATVTNDIVSPKQPFVSWWGRGSNHGASDDPAAGVKEESKQASGSRSKLWHRGSDVSSGVTEESKQSPRSRPKLWPRALAVSSSPGRRSPAAKDVATGNRWDRQPDGRVSNGGAVAATNRKKTCFPKSKNSESLRAGGGDKSSAGVTKCRSDAEENAGRGKERDAYGDKVSGPSAARH